MFCWRKSDFYTDFLAKRRSLKLSFVNLSKNDTICCTNQFFKTGKFYNQPVDTVPPGHKQTIFVMNTEGLHLAGVSGGVAMVVNTKVKILKLSRRIFMPEIKLDVNHAKLFGQHAQK